MNNLNKTLEDRNNLMNKINSLIDGIAVIISEEHLEELERLFFVKDDFIHSYQILTNQINHDLKNLSSIDLKIKQSIRIQEDKWQSLLRKDKKNEKLLEEKVRNLKLESRNISEKKKVQTAYQTRQSFSKKEFEG